MKEIIIPKNIQNDIMLFFLKTSIPRIINNNYIKEKTNEW